MLKGGLKLVKGRFGCGSGGLHLALVSLPPRHASLRDHCSRTPGVSLHEYYVILIKLKNMQQLCRSVHVGNIQHVPQGNRYTKLALNLKT